MKDDTDYSMYDFKDHGQMLSYLNKLTNFPINAKVDQEDFSEVIKRLENMVTGEFIDVFKVVATDERYNTFTVAFTLKYDQALQLAKGTGSWGSDGSVERTTLFKRGMKDGAFKYYEFKEVNVTDPISEKEIKEKALAKLTSEEIKILGLDK